MIFYIKQVLFCSWSRRPNNCSAIRKQPPSRPCWRAGGFLRAFRVCRRVRARCWRRHACAADRRCWPCARRGGGRDVSKRCPAGAGRAADGARLYVLYGRERLAPDGAKAPEALYALAAGTAPAVVCTVSGLLQRAMPKEKLPQAAFEIRDGSSPPPEDVEDVLPRCGYLRTAQVEGRASFRAAAAF